MSKSVLDASALIALIRREPGGVLVEQSVANGAAIGAVNLAETVSKLSDAGFAEDEIRRQLDGLDLEVIAFDEEQAFLAGVLREATRAAGLSLGDRACLALALRLGLPALSADRNWGSVSVGVEVRIIR